MAWFSMLSAVFTKLWLCAQTGRRTRQSFSQPGYVVLVFALVEEYEAEKRLDNQRFLLFSPLLINHFL